MWGCARRLGGALRGGRSRGWAPYSRHNSSSVSIPSALFGIRWPSPPALLSERGMPRALCAMGDTTRQKTLTCSSRPGARMRACPGILQLVSIPRLRGYGASGPGDGLLEANAMCLPSIPSPLHLFIFLMIIVHGASLPRPSGIRIDDTRPRRRAACSHSAATTRVEFGHGTGRRVFLRQGRAITHVVKNSQSMSGTALAPALAHTARTRLHTVESAASRCRPARRARRPP